MRRKEAALVLMALDASNLPLSLNIEDRRNENYTVNYPTRKSKSSPASSAACSNNLPHHCAT